MYDFTSVVFWLGFGAGTLCWKATNRACIGQLSVWHLVVSIGSSLTTSTLEYTHACISAVKPVSVMYIESVP